jgi:hypothetical protein
MYVFNQPLVTTNEARIPELGSEGVEPAVNALSSVACGRATKSHPPRPDLPVEGVTLQRFPVQGQLQFTLLVDNGQHILDEMVVLGVAKFAALVVVQLGDFQQNRTNGLDTLFFCTAEKQGPDTFANDRRRPGILDQVAMTKQPPKHDVFLVAELGDETA